MTSPMTGRWLSAMLFRGEVIHGPWGSLRYMKDRREKPVKEDLRYMIHFGSCDAFDQCCEIMEGLRGTPASWKATGWQNAYRPTGRWTWPQGAKWAVGRPNVFLGGWDDVQTALLPWFLAEAA